MGMFTVYEAKLGGSLPRKRVMQMIEQNMHVLQHNQFLFVWRVTQPSFLKINYGPNNQAIKQISIT
jgi:hypothetical protein